MSHKILKIILLLLLIPFMANASLVEDFETYSTGDLNGQGGWATTCGFSTWLVSTTAGVYYSGAKGVRCDDPSEGACYADKSFTSDTNGNQQFYVKTSNTGKSEYISIMEGTTYLYTVRFVSGVLQYYDGTGYINIVDSLVANTWYGVEIDWRSSDKYARYRYNTAGGAWNAYTDWDTPRGSYSSAVNAVRMEMAVGADVTEGYWDFFQDPNAAPPATPVEDFIQPLIITF